MRSTDLHIKAVKDILLSLPLQKERAPIALLGPIGMGKTASVENGVRKLAEVYNTPTVLVSWFCSGGTAFVEYIKNKKIDGKKFVNVDVLPKDSTSYIFYPDGTKKRMNLYDILPKYKTFLKDKYVVFLLEYFTLLPPNEQVKFVDFFDNFRIGIYDFKKHSKDVFIIIESHYITIDYTYGLDPSISRRISVFPVYITNDYILKIARGEI